MRSHYYAMLNEYGKHARYFGAFLFLFQFGFQFFGVVFNKTIIPLALIGYKMIIQNLLSATRLIGYLPSHDISYTILRCVGFCPCILHFICEVDQITIDLTYTSASRIIDPVLNIL